MQDKMRRNPVTLVLLQTHLIRGLEQLDLTMWSNCEKHVVMFIEIYITYIKTKKILDERQKFCQRVAVFYSLP